LQHVHQQLTSLSWTASADDHPPSRASDGDRAPSSFLQPTDGSGQAGLPAPPFKIVIELI
jgi:hypothetical protein